ncbi:MAG: ATP-binding protein [Candidatus Micrarchaeia archaeon]|jgi:type IV secretory pathway VirB4 component
MGRLKLTDVSNVTLSKRNIFVRPPEPPAEFLMNDPGNSIFVGKTKIFHIPFSWSFAKLTNPHMAVVGITGSGKSYFIKTFLTRASFVWNTNALIIDWAGEYKDWVKQTGGTVIALGKGASINLLDLGGMRPNDRVKQIIRTLGILTDIESYPEQKRLTEMAIEKAYKQADFKMDNKIQRDNLGKPLIPPTLKDVQRLLEKQLKSGTYEFPAELENAIYRIKKFTRQGDDYFSTQSTIDLDDLTTSGLVGLDLSGLPDEVFRALAALSILQFLKEKMRATGWSDVKGIRLLVVLDEAWKIAKEETSDAVMIVREGRKYNFGLIVASQHPIDISESIFSNVGSTFIFRVKFERYLDFLQNTLNFSDYIRNEIRGFGVGQCAVNLIPYQAVRFSENFLVDKVLGEDPISEYFLDLKNVLTEAQMRDENMARTVSFEKEALRKKMRAYGLEELQIEDISRLFEQKNRHIDIISFVILLERYGLARRNITSFLKDLGLNDSTIINVFSKADFKKLGIGESEIMQVILEE